MSIGFHFDDDEEDKFEGMGIGIGHKDDIPEDTFESMGIGIGHRDDTEYVQISFFDDDQPLGKEAKQ